MYNSAFQSLIVDEDYLRELDYFIGDATSPLFKSFIEAISAKAEMMKLCGRWADEGEAGICRLLKVWSLRFLKGKFVKGVPYGYGIPEVVWKEGSSQRAAALDGELKILIHALGDEIPMGGCLIVSSSDCNLSSSDCNKIVRDFDDYREAISVDLSAGALVEAEIDESNLIVTFYGYDFAYYDGVLFHGIFTQVKK